MKNPNFSQLPKHIQYEIMAQPNTSVSKYTTVIILSNRKTGKKGVGVSHCSNKDKVNYDLGRCIALGRAMKQLGLG